MNTVSTHFYLSEVTASDTADRLHIDNSLPPALLPVIAKVATAMERVRCMLGDKSVLISSWYRCAELNAALKSKPTSQHMQGEAVDFRVPAFGTPLAICKQLIANSDLIRYDQLILEHSWVHISFAIRTGKPKLQVLSLLETGGYATGLTDKKGKPL